MQIELYVIDAFTETIFKGNPAAVCPLNEWLPDETMRKIAAEFAVSETAFLVKDNNRYQIRWFTPSVEMDLCGHATLASAYVLFQHKSFQGETIEFNSRSGLLTVTKNGDVLYLDFPSRPAETGIIPPELAVALGVEPLEILVSRDYLVLLPSERDVRELKPDIDMLGKLDKAVIVTAPGDTADFVSRFFAPTFGISEDPVTGSSHCTLIPYWSRRLSKRDMIALQVSKRGGKLYCSDKGDRVKIGGKAVTYLKGGVYLQEENLTA